MTTDHEYSKLNRVSEEAYWKSLEKSNRTTVGGVIFTFAMLLLVIVIGTIDTSDGEPDTIFAVFGLIAIVILFFGLLVSLFLVPWFIVVKSNEAIAAIHRESTRAREDLTKKLDEVNDTLMMLKSSRD